ncbi:hypothetical protein [Bosea sp. ANAM02]|uniref:hypothetical protein n=1 Tax=Bosea sp. ANAM02 TaxID=2020412 RepID=UPI00156669CF|nr:hypothetical protein [Bosea sp. ANAM02]
MTYRGFFADHPRGLSLRGRTTLREFYPAQPHNVLRLECKHDISKNSLNIRNLFFGRLA